MKKRTVLLCAGGLALAAAAAGATYWHKTADVRRIKDEVAFRLKDPDSAKFEGVFYNPVERVGCGYVNAKNGFGAFVGARQFYFVDDTQHLEFAPDEAGSGSTQERLKQAQESLEFHKTYMRLCLNVEPQ